MRASCLTAESPSFVTFPRGAFDGAQGLLAGLTTIPLP
jgi:hypothetical protein